MLEIEVVQTFPSWVRAAQARTGRTLSDTSPIPVAAIRAVGADSAGRVYVLDAAARRVLVFDSTGSDQGVIGGGYGEGPGQFQHPGDMHVSASGELLVTDIGWHRVTWFDTSGSVTSTFAFGMGIPTTAILHDSTILVKRNASPRTDSLVLRTTLGGEVTGAFRVGDTHQRAMAEAGPLGVLTTTSAGTPIFVTPYPARWVALAPEAHWLGHDLLPDLATEHAATPGTEVPLSYLQTAVLGAACPDLGECLLTVLRMTDPSDPNNSGYDTWAYLIDSTGSIRAGAQLEDVSGIWRAPGMRRLFLAVTEPEPHVALAEYSITASASAQ